MLLAMATSVPCCAAGATGGIGLRLVQMLVEDGHIVLLGCRTAEKGKQAIQQLPAGKQSLVELFICDLTHDSATIRGAAEQVASTHSKLDVLVLNAGVWNTKLILTAAGAESTLASNHLGHFVLTDALMPLLSAAPAPRVVSLSSSLHALATSLPPWVLFQVSPAFQQLVGGPPASPLDAGVKIYALTKLYNIWFVQELAKHASTQSATQKLWAASVCPGWVPSTDIKRHGGFFAWLSGTYVAKLGVDVDEAARRVHLLAVGDGPSRAPSGTYWANGKPAKLKQMDPAAAPKLWDLSMQATGTKKFLDQHVSGSPS